MNDLSPTLRIHGAGIQCLVIASCGAAYADADIWPVTAVPGESARDEGATATTEPEPTWT